MTVPSPTLPHNPFADFYTDPLYVEFKNHLYNYRIRRKQIRKVIDQFEKQDWILEIGSGISTITRGGSHILYSDIAFNALCHLKEKGVAKNVVVMSITEIALKNDSVPAIVCSEVLEHIRDDRSAIQEMHRVLRSEGSLVLTVPVHPRYYSFDDKLVKHERRYAIWPLLKKLRKAGFENLHLVKVTGVLDRIAMIALASVYSVFSNPQEHTSEQKPVKSPPFLKVLFPIYKILNKIFGRLVRWEAKLMPLSSTAVILVHCTKKK